MTQNPVDTHSSMWLTAQRSDYSSGEKRRKAAPETIISYLEDNGFTQVSLDNRKPVDRNGDTLELGHDLIHQMAADLDLLSGKWAFRIEEKNAYSSWQQIEQLVNDSHVPNAKISTKKQIAEELRDDYVTCIYTQDYTDQDDVTAIRDLLRDDGFQQDMMYKPDIYTALGIYEHNMDEFGLDDVAVYRDTLS